jgi:spermidine synthase
VSVDTLRAPASLRAILALIGFTAVIAQIVLMRELIVVFYGNEISLGLILANWLAWTALGSSVLGRIVPRVQNSHRLMAVLQGLIAVAFPGTILAVRASKSAFQPIPGEVLGPGPMLLTSLVVLSLFCAISGLLFAAGSRLYADRVGTSTVRGTSSVYLLEAAGSGLGGMLASLVLIRFLTAFEIAALLGLLNLLAAASLVIPIVSRRRAILAALLGIVLAILFLSGARWLEATSLAHLWSGFHLVATRNSAYGNLAVVETPGSRSLFENGVVVFSVPDPAAAEEGVHYALLQHPAPRSLLLIGGGVNGSLAQALQHSSLERVDYVELDPAILDLAEKHFPREWAPIRTDPRVRVHNTDGRLLLKTTAQTYDVIIVNLPEPQTAQLNRFYTLDFFREAAERLSPAGVLSFQLHAAEDYISPELGAFLRCINRTLREIFPAVTAIPGDPVHFFAAKQSGMLTTDPQTLVSRLRERGIQTSYVREYYIPYRMSPDRTADLEQHIRPQADTPVNRDLAPIAYYFDVALWSTRFNAGYRQLFESIARVSFGSLVFAVGGLLCALGGALRWLPGREKRPRASAGFCVGAMGFTLIGLEILLLLGFQAIYGYVYHQLAIVIASFMVGMALGSWRGLRRPVEGGARPLERTEIQALAGLQVLAAASPLLLYALLVLLARIKDPVGLFAVSQILFPALALLSGFLGGYQFPVASRIFFASAREETRSPGTLYALDLVGACLGAVLLSAYLVPVFGFLKTSVLMAVANIVPAALAALAAFEAGEPQEE